MKGKQIAFIVFILFAFADVMATINAFDVLGYQSSELNPIFLIFNSFWVVIVANIIGAFVIWWALFKVSSVPSITFFYISLLIWLILPRSVAIQSANYEAEHPKPEEENKYATMPKQEKANTYFSFLKTTLLIPIAITQLIFWLFSLEYDFVKKKKNPMKELVEEVRDNGY